MYYSLLQHIAAYSIVLQSVIYSLLHVFQHFTVCYSILQCVLVYYIVLQCITVYYHMSQSFTMYCSF